MIPTLLYGTAWKEDRTEALVAAALEEGFRGIDTANQRKHYFEEGVGRALRASKVPREQLFLQTKFTFRDGQDHRLPFDPRAKIEDQVAQSFRSSLEHLGVTYLDSLVLHGPSAYEGLDADDHAAWRAMEARVDEGGVKLLGASNVSPKQVDDLVKLSKKKISFVQNRCHAARGWDRDVRAACKEHGIVYQGFSLLTANRTVLASPDLRAIAQRHGKTPAQIVFRFAIHLGMLPLTGTTDRAHMREDLDATSFELDPREVLAIEHLG